MQQGSLPVALSIKELKVRHYGCAFIKVHVYLCLVLRSEILLCCFGGGSFSLFTNARKSVPKALRKKV